MRTLILFILASFALTLCACSKPLPPAENTMAPAPLAIGDNSQNALDWAGIYIGTLPCADCEGIATRISLDKDLRYTLSETYLGKSDKPMLIEGTFAWNSDGNRITLQGIKAGTRSTQFQVGENRIKQLDLQGVKIESALTGQYVLEKQP